MKPHLLECIGCPKELLARGAIYVDGPVMLCIPRELGTIIYSDASTYLHQGLLIDKHPIT